jgi:excisionase family DNA binding protein
MTTPLSSDDEPILLSLEQVRRKLGVSRWTLYQIINRGELQTVHIGHRHLVHPDQLQRYLDWLMAQGGDDAG